MPIFGDGAGVQGHAETHSRGGQRGLVSARHGELELVAMAGARGAVARSRAYGGRARCGHTFPHGSGGSG